MSACVNCGAELQSVESSCVSCGASQKASDWESEVAASETSCVGCDRRRLRFLGGTLGSWIRCRRRRVRKWYWGNRARWWMPHLTGDVGPGCLLSPGLLSAVAVVLALSILL